jgi:hypothetical protein
MAAVVENSRRRWQEELVTRDKKPKRAGRREREMPTLGVVEHRRDDGDMDDTCMDLKGKCACTTAAWVDVRGAPAACVVGTRRLLAYLLPVPGLSDLQDLEAPMLNDDTNGLSGLEQMQRRSLPGLPGEPSEPLADLARVRDAVRELTDKGPIARAEIAFECISRRDALVQQCISLGRDVPCRREQMCCSF